MKERASNMELLRVVSMLLIIFGHYFVCGIGFKSPDFASMGQKSACFWFSGNVGVHLFVLISGYFMVNLPFSLKRLAKLACVVSFYSLTLFLAVEYGIRGNNHVSLSDCMHFLFPIMYTKYWFISTYVQLMLLSPFINHLFHAAGARRSLCFVGICALCCVYFRVESHPLLLFIFLYSLAAYIRLYASCIYKIPAKIYLTGFVLMYALAAGTLYGVHLAKHQFHCPYLYRFAHLFILSPYSLPVIFMSLVGFLGFLRLQMPANKFINTMASTTLAAYLIHAHPAVNSVLWKLLGAPEMLSSPYLYLHCLGCVLGIFCTCAVIELLRNAIMQKALNYLIDKLVSPLERLLGAWVTRCSRY